VPRDDAFQGSTSVATTGSPAACTEQLTGHEMAWFGERAQGQQPTLARRRSARHLGPTTRPW